MDYRNLMAEDTWNFVQITQDFYPDTRTGLTLEDQRRLYNALCRHFAHPHPEHVRAENRNIGNVACRRYRCGEKSPARVMYIHGGGFVVGGLDSHDDICAEICAMTGFDVIAVDYRLAPEHKHPAALEDCLAAFDALLGEDAAPLVLAGDSAGAWLAAMVSFHRQGMASGQALIYPMLGGALNRGSYISHAEAPLLSTAQVAKYWQTYFDCPLDRSKLTPPMALDDLGVMPPTFMLAAECDPLASDTPDFAARIRASGGKVITATGEGLPHGFLRARHHAKAARDSFARITAAIHALGRGQWPC